jgi:perosamine synthetase
MALSRRRTLYLDEPNVGAVEKLFLNRAIDMGYVSTAGPFVNRFENSFARFCGSKKAVSTQSGTSAIHVSLYEANVRAGDEVIVPVLTFVATVNPVLQLGARPVFVDIDSATWNLDIRQVEKAITKKTKAILPVHLFGNPCDMAPLVSLARKHNAVVIEDATESLGATYRSRMTGTIGDFGCFSFNGNKIITTGGGGMVLCRDVKRFEHIHLLVNQARKNNERLFCTEMGFNYRMTNIEAALGLAQMKRLGLFLEQKKLFNHIYKKELGTHKRVHFQTGTDGTIGSWWMSSAIFQNKDAADLQKRLNGKGIPSRRIFMPLTVFPHCSPFATQSFPQAHAIYEQGLCLPSSTLNSAEDIEYACSVIKKML